MMNSISSLAWRFSAHRMVADYVHALLPARRRRLKLRHERAVSRVISVSASREYECSVRACAVQ